MSPLPVQKLPGKAEEPNEASYPIFISGKVVHGFGRGGKDLGVPTANLPEETVNQVLAAIPIGIYYGWAQLETEGVVRPMVMSLGWNPYYRNEKRSGEVHIIHKYDYDFYDHVLKVCITGYIRPERDFASLDELIGAIETDIKIAKERLADDSVVALKQHVFFTGQD